MRGHRHRAGVTTIIGITVPSHICRPTVERGRDGPQPRRSASSALAAQLGLLSVFDGVVLVVHRAHVSKVAE